MSGIYSLVWWWVTMQCLHAACHEEGRVIAYAHLISQKVTPLGVLGSAQSRGSTWPRIMHNCLKSPTLTLPHARPMLGPERAGPGVCLTPPPPSNSAGPRSDTRLATFERASQIMTKVLRLLFRSVTKSVPRGQQKSYFALFNVFLWIGAWLGSQRRYSVAK